jgi:hypothetical protein
MSKPSILGANDYFFVPSSSFEYHPHAQETGGHMITPLPGAWAEKPGSATLPFFGVIPAILDPETGKELEGEAEGVLCIKQVISCPISCTELDLGCRKFDPPSSFPLPSLNEQTP